VVSVSKGFSKGNILGHLEKYRGRVKRCFENGLSVKGKGMVRILFSLELGESGQVLNTKVIRSTAGDEKIGSCILKSLKKLRISSSGGVKEGTVTILFSFKR